MGLKMKIFGEFKLEKNYNHSCSSKKKLGLVKITFGLYVHDASHRQAVKLTFFAPYS